MDCVVCHTPAGMFSHKCEDGPVCNVCYSKTPSIFKAKDFDSGVVRFLCRTYDNENTEMCRKFRETCKIGNFHFDSEHLLGVIGKINKDGTIDEGNSDIFSMANLKEINFSMVNTKAFSDRKVTCDIQMTCSFHDSFWKINEIVSRGERCFAQKSSESGVVEFSMPAGVQIVWDDIIKYVNLSRGSKTNAINESLVTEDDLNLFKARVLFMLDTDYSKEEIEEVYQRLKSAFSGDEKRLKEIERAMYILEDHLAMRIF